MAFDVTSDLLLGVDIGSYSSKGVLVSPAGEVLATATVEHDMSFPRPGWAEHDADKIWWGEFVTITRQLLSGKYSGADIGGVAVSAIGSCMLPVDEAGNALRPGVLYGIDTRSTAEIDWLNQHFGEQPMFDLGAMALTSQAIGPKILWLRNNEPDIYARTHKILTASSYPVLKLTGEMVMDRHSASYYNPLIDISRLEWDDRFAEPIIDPDRLPRLLWSDEIAGEVTPAAAAITGLRAGTPVTTGTIDAAAEAISVGVVDPGDLMVMYGTTMFFIQVTDRPTPDPRMWCCGFCFEGRYGIEGGMSTTGALTRWFRDQFGQQELAAEANGGGSAYAALADLAAGIPAGSQGLICLPYLSGERTPLNDPLARGVFAGLTLSHTRAHLYRATREATAFGVRDNLDVMGQMGADPKRIVAVGGGTQNPLWLQIVSDVTGKTQIVPERTIGASYGDAFLAGIATGIISDRDSINRQWVKTARTRVPDPAMTEIYEPYYRIYKSLYESTRDDMHRLAELGQKAGII
jgi:xylulokinase